MSIWHLESKLTRLLTKMNPAFTEGVHGGAGAWTWAAVNQTLLIGDEGGGYERGVGGGIYKARRESVH